MTNITVNHFGTQVKMEVVPNSLTGSGLFSYCEARYNGMTYFVSKRHTNRVWKTTPRRPY